MTPYHPLRLFRSSGPVRLSLVRHAYVVSIGDLVSVAGYETQPDLRFSNFALALTHARQNAGNRVWRITDTVTGERWDSQMTVFNSSSSVH